MSPAVALPSEGGVQAGPEVLVVGQGGQGARGVAVALVQEGGEGRVHALGTLGAPKLLCFKHLHTQQGQLTDSKRFSVCKIQAKKKPQKHQVKRVCHTHSWENRGKGHLILRTETIIK